MTRNIKILGFIIVFFFGILILLTSQMDKSRIKYSGEAMISKIKTQSYVIDDLKGLSKPVIIDLKEPQLFVSDHLPKAINIPFSLLLNNNYQSVWQDEHAKVLYGVDEMKLHQSWMLLTQMGFENIYVLAKNVKNGLVSSDTGPK
ncbi:MAG TPA: rhodanese-like domain-containing protein [Cyclobacteriaceae bacterium]